jgi:hypothetical protein
MYFTYIKASCIPHIATLFASSYLQLEYNTRIISFLSHKSRFKFLAGMSIDFPFFYCCDRK